MTYLNEIRKIKNLSVDDIIRVAISEFLWPALVACITINSISHFHRKDIKAISHMES